jgi:GNAT superfamily N-acetyltransferase
VTALTFQPVTHHTLDDFVALFDGPGGPSFCWCMVWRATAKEGRGTPGSLRKKQMLSRIKKDIPVGLIAYQNSMPVGWVSIAPRQTYQRLKGPSQKPNEIIWSLVCMYIQRKCRGQGLAHRLIAAAVKHARENGATIIEAYPVAADAPSYKYLGLVPTYERAGFTFIEMADKRRHVMRLSLN